MRMSDEPKITERDMLPTDPAADEAASHAEDAFLAALTDEGEPAEPEAEPEAAAPEPEQPADTEPEPTAAEPTADAEDYQKALTALRFEGLDSLAETLSREQLITAGLKLREKQTARDVTLAENAKRLKELESKLEATATGEPSSAEPTPEPDFTELDPVLGELSEEAGKALKGYIQKQAQLQAQRDQQFSQALMSAQAQAVQLQLDSLRGRLGERFPGLREDASFGQVTEKMSLLSELISSGKYQADSAEQVMIDAARIVGLEEQRPDVKSAQRLEEARQNGTPSPETKRSEQSKTRNADPESEVLAYLEEHPGDVGGAGNVWRQMASP